MAGSRFMLALALVACLAAVAYSQSLVGGLEDEKPADQHLEGIMKQAMSKLQASYPGGFKDMQPISYRTQVVSGMNYFVRVKVTENSGSTKHAHLRLYRPFRSDIEVHGIKTDVTESSPLKYFQMP